MSIGTDNNTCPIPSADAAVMVTAVQSDNIHRYSVVLLMLMATLVLLKLGAPVLAPLAVAVFLIAMAWPIKTGLNRYLPDSLSYIGAVLALTLVLALFIILLALSFTELMNTLPKYQTDISRFWRETKQQLMVNGVDTASSRLTIREVIDFLIFSLDDFHETVISLLMIFAYVILALPELTGWQKRFRVCLGKDHAQRLLNAAEAFGKSFQSYMAAMTICGIINAAITYAIVGMAGLDFSVTWGLLAFLLSFIPVVGAFLTVIPPTILAFLQFDTPQEPLFIFGALAFLHLIIGNIIEPKIQGKMLSLSPLVVLISLSIWGYLWGVTGALLAAPLTHGIIIACSHYAPTRWIACLLSDSASRSSLPNPK